MVHDGYRRLATWVVLPMWAARRASRFVACQPTINQPAELMTDARTIKRKPETDPGADREPELNAEAITDPTRRGEDTDSIRGGFGCAHTRAQATVARPERELTAVSPARLASGRRALPARSVALAALAERMADRYRDPALASVGLADAPLSSLAFGAAGIAYFLFRHASFGGGESSLQAATRWAAQAERAAHREGAFSLPGEPGGSPPQHSLHYHAPGVWWVRALVANAGDDRAQVRRSAGRFADAAARALGAPGDVSTGSAGLLLGCAQLVVSLGDPIAAAPVRAEGERLALELVALADREGALPGEAALGYLGAAHGWGGVAQALLRWSRAICEPPPPQVLALLERLIALRRPSGRWPVSAGSRDVYRGWCHGSAGWTQLWALAWELTGERRLLSLAEHGAHDAVAAEEDTVSLCCGRAGEAYAALTLYRATGEEYWLRAAERVAARAVRAPTDAGTPAHRLFSGELGVALLAAELEDPTRAAMPVYQPIN